MDEYHLPEQSYWPGAVTSNPPFLVVSGPILTECLWLQAYYDLLGASLYIANVVVGLMASALFGHYSLISVELSAMFR